jgi:hypothetical protein
MDDPLMREELDNKMVDEAFKQLVDSYLASKHRKKVVNLHIVVLNPHIYTTVFSHLKGVLLVTFTSTHTDAESRLCGRRSAFRT